MTLRSLIEDLATSVAGQFNTQKALINGKVSADNVSATKWAHGPRVDDLTYPVLIAHRGGSDLSPENSVAAYKNGVVLGFEAVEAGDVQALSDGTLVCMHDSTVDRTTNGTGNVNTFTKSTWLALSMDYGSQWGGAYVAEPPVLWEDALNAMSGRCVIVPEVKDQLDATATAMCDRLDALGAQASTIIQSFSLSNLTIASARGYKTLYLGATSAGMIAALGDAKTAGVWAVGLDYTQADVTAANVALIQASGFRVFIYTPVHQYQTAAVLALGCDGIFTNESPGWVQSDFDAYRTTATQFHVTGKWEAGMVSTGDNYYMPGTSGNRGTLVGPGPGAYRVSLNTGVRGMLAGRVCPVANAAGTYTIQAAFVVEALPTTTTQGPAIYACMPDDSTTNGGTGADMANSYMVKARANGTLQMWEISATGTSTSLGTSGTATFQNLTTTAVLTGGTAYTTLAVSALTVALKVGHMFMLPNGQIVTVATAASVGATSVTIQSVRMTSTVASGSVLRPYVVIQLTVTPTNVLASRADEPSVAAINVANSAHRGGFIAASGTSFSAPGVMSLHKVTIT